MNKEIIGVLRRLGLNQYESKTYFALTSSKASTATELSDVASIPRPRVYDVLAKLEKRGFVVSQPGRPARYSAVPVPVAVGALKREKQRELDKELNELAKLEKQLGKHLEGAVLPAGEEGEVFTITDRKSIYAALEELIRQSKEHILLSSNKEGLARKRNEYGPLLHLAQKRGVAVRIVEGPKRAAIVDDHSLIFLNDGMGSAKEDKAAWIRSGFLSKAMREVI
ncbi:MAG: TrmB family transcriptional regulator [Candidatus Diapherotrites archaeon]|nr:TrmB family transcriptional regulator [Candidatus Diapherotrites archaeon]